MEQTHSMNESLSLSLASLTWKCIARKILLFYTENKMWHEMIINNENKFQPVGSSQFESRRNAEENKQINQNKKKYDH